MSIFTILRPRRRNLLLYSEDFTQAAWAQYSPTSTVTANQAQAPNGAMTADQIQFGGSDFRYQLIGLSGALMAGKTWTFSVWIWSAAKATIALRLLDAPGTEQAVQAVTLTPKPVRYAVSRAFTSTDGSFVAGLDNRIAFGDGIAGSIYVWGAQLAPGRCPYIATQGTRK